MQERIRIKEDFISTYNSESPVSYQMRAVAFFDILGWKNAVQDSTNDPSMRARLLNVVWYFSARLRDYVETETSITPSQDEFSQFSDSIIVSFPYDQPLDFYRLLRFVAEFQSTMLMQGFPLRGGVTIGEMIHNGPIAFGPAMNRAYELENYFAKSPRVIIDPVYNEVLKQSQKYIPKHWPYTFCIDDDFHEIDFLTSAAMSQSALGIIERKITHWIDIYSNDERILEKYIALQRRWEFAKGLAEEKIKLRKNT